MKKSKTIVLLSGGLDSVANLALAHKHKHEILAVFFNYGQRAFAREKFAAKKIANFYKIKLIEIDVCGIYRLASKNSVLFKKSAKLPSCSLNESTVKSVWVPNRNAVFLNIAAAISEEIKANLILAGFNKEEGKFFPDNSKAFIAAINKSLTYSTQNKVKVDAFTKNLNKRQIAKILIEEKAPIKYIWSCYSQNKKPCGECESCMRFKNAFIKNGESGKAAIKGIFNV